MRILTLKTLKLPFFGSYSILPTSQTLNFNCRIQAKALVGLSGGLEDRRSRTTGLWETSLALVFRLLR